MVQKVATKEEEDKLALEVDVILDELKKETVKFKEKADGMINSLDDKIGGTEHLYERVEKDLEELEEKSFNEARDLEESFVEEFGDLDLTENPPMTEEIPEEENNQDN